MVMVRCALDSISVQGRGSRWQPPWVRSPTQDHPLACPMGGGDILRLESVVIDHVDLGTLGGAVRQIDLIKQTQTVWAAIEGSASGADGGVDHGGICLGLAHCRASVGHHQVPFVPAVKVSQRPLTVQDAVCYLETCGGGVDSNIKATQTQTQQLIARGSNGVGVDPSVDQVLDGGGGLDSHWSGCDWNQYKGEEGER